MFLDNTLFCDYVSLGATVLDWVVLMIICLYLLDTFLLCIFRFLVMSFFLYNSLCLCLGYGVVVLTLNTMEFSRHLSTFIFIQTPVWRSTSSTSKVVAGCLFDRFILSQGHLIPLSSVDIIYLLAPIPRLSHLCLEKCFG